MSSMSATARGTLGNTPLGELLIFCLQRRLSGSLVFDSKGFGRSALSLHDGAVLKGKLGAKACLLGDVCVSLGYLDQQLLTAALRSMGALRLGKHLVESLLIEEEQLRVALSVQMLEQVEWCSRLAPDTVYGYYQDDFLAGWAGGARSVDPLTIIWRASRSSDTLERARAICHGLGGRVLRLHNDARVGRFDFDPEVRPALDVLRAKPQPYPELRSSGLADEDLLSRVLAVLALTQHLDLGANLDPLGVNTGDSKPPTQVPRQHRRYRRPGETTHIPGSPLSRPPEAPPMDERRVAIQEMAQKVGALTFYEVLGVPPEADAASIQQAFFQLARKWHPDKLGADLSDQREAATRVFARMTEAHQVLGVPAQRAEYDRLLQEGNTSQEEQEKVQQILRAAATFQKAELLARRSDWQAAEKAAEKAYRDDREQPEYGALYAWIVAKSGQRAETGNYEDLVDILSKAVKQLPDHVRIRFYRAQVLKLSGRADLAMRDFRAIAELDPHHVEAARELRLHRMRAASSEASDGLFGRFFKKG